MTTAYSTNLGLALPVQGELSGTWGDMVNYGITDYVDIAVAGTLALTSASFTANALTLANTNGTSSGTNISATTAQYMVLKVSSLAANVTITAPSLSKLYLVDNADTTYTVTIKASGQTGYTVAKSTKAWVYFNGTDYVLASTNSFNAISPITSTGDLILGNGTNSATRLAIGANGTVLQSNGTTAAWAAAATGDVTAAGNNAFTGANTFYNATGQTFAPASTNDGIIVKGRAGGTSSYRITLAPTTLSASRTVTYPDADTTIPVATQVITFSGPTAARTYTLPDSASTLAALATAQTFTALQTFSGSTSVAAAKMTNAKEVATVSATAATGTIAYDVTTQSVLYYTSNASANWTVNFRGSSGTSLDTLMSTGESMTVAFLVTQGATAYYNSAVQVDGNSVTPKYQGGTAWSAGNASGVDAYVYTIVKTGSATFTVFASQTQFK